MKIGESSLMEKSYTDKKGSMGFDHGKVFDVGHRADEIGTDGTRSLCWGANCQLHCADRKFQCRIVILRLIDVAWNSSRFSDRYGGLVHRSAWDRHRQPLRNCCGYGRSTRALPVRYLAYLFSWCFLDLSYSCESFRQCNQWRSG